MPKHSAPYLMNLPGACCRYSCGPGPCQCEERDIILVAVPVPLKVCLNKPLDRRAVFIVG